MNIFLMHECEALITMVHNTEGFSSVYFKGERERCEEKIRKTGAAAAKSLQLCLTLWDPIDSSPPGSPIPGSLQARTQEWVAISFSNAWKWKVKMKSLSRVQLLATPWAAVYQAPPSMGFSRQEYWNGVPLPSLKDKRVIPNLAWRNLELSLCVE